MMITLEMAQQIADYNRLMEKDDKIFLTDWECVDLRPTDFSQYDVDDTKLNPIKEFYYRLRFGGRTL